MHTPTFHDPYVSSHGHPKEGVLMSGSPKLPGADLRGRGSFQDKASALVSWE